jgi:uncharacterized protein (DUF885 family)
MRQGMAEGIVAAKCSLEGVADQLSALDVGEVDASLFFKPFKNAPSYDDDDEREVINEARVLITTTISASLKRLAAFTTDEYLPCCRDNIAATSLPQGGRYYSACLRFHTGTDLSAQQIHDVGISEVRRIWGEMTAVAAEAGYEEGMLIDGDDDDDNNDDIIAAVELPASVQGICGGAGTVAQSSAVHRYVRELRNADEQYHKSEEALLDSYRNLSMKIQSRLLTCFPLDVMPRIPFAVEATPAHQAPSAPTAYYLGPDGNGERPGTFYANCHDLRSRPKYEMESLCLHEAIPGHHLQMCAQVDNPALEPFRRHIEDRRYFEVITTP